MTQPSAEARFESHYIPEPMSGCWLWVGAFRGNGYSMFMVSGRKVAAHRFSYEFYVGPIPPGFDVDHLCRVRSCVNPRHLEPVTPTENKLRGVGITAINAKKMTCHRGHSDYQLIFCADGRLKRQCITCKREADRLCQERRLARVHARRSLSAEPEPRG